MSVERPDWQDGQSVETETAVVPRGDDGRLVRSDWTAENSAPGDESSALTPDEGREFLERSERRNNAMAENAGDAAPAPLDDAARAVALDKVDAIEKNLSPEGLAAAEEWLSSLSDQERESILRQLVD